MSTFSILKNELLKQKSAVEEKYGTVNVANLNPSPSEITEGIKSIPFVDLSNSTATESDVKQGKTFYSGDATLRTGTAIVSMDEINAMFVYPDSTQSYDEQIYFSIPSGITTLKKYLFYRNYNKVDITFNSDLKTIDDYAFYYTKNFSFKGFNDIVNLTKIGTYGFAYSSCDGFDIARLPDTITNLNDYAFYYTIQEYSDFKFPDGLINLGQYVYMSNTRQMQNSLDLSNYNITSLYPYTFYYHSFACDFVTPSKVKNIGMYFNYNGTFRNITIKSNTTALNNHCFGGASTQSAENFYLKTVTFEAETPPSIGTNVFALQNIQNGLKIYVPDESIDAYKEVSNLSKYLECICPMSEKP